MSELQVIADQIVRSFSRRAKRMSLSVKSIKLIFIAGAAIAALGFQVTLLDSDSSLFQVLSLASTAIVVIGAVFLALIDQDSSVELSLAYKALETAREFELSRAGALEQRSDYERLVYLYQSTTVMRLMLEHAIKRSAGQSIGDLLQILLDGTKNSLAVSTGFGYADYWTIVIYRNTESSPRTMRCIASVGSMPMEIDHARVWPEGVGVIGISSSSRQEVIVEDMKEAGSIFSLGGTSDGTDRYRSVIAVPIILAEQAGPWGVVTATTNRPHHFTASEEAGFKTTEPIRAIAGMVSFAVELTQDRQAIDLPRGDSATLGEPSDVLAKADAAIAQLKIAASPEAGLDQSLDELIAKIVAGIASPEDIKIYHEVFAKRANQMQPLG